MSDDRTAGGGSMTLDYVRHTANGKCHFYPKNGEYWAGKTENHTKAICGRSKAPVVSRNTYVVGSPCKACMKIALKNKVPIRFFIPSTTGA